MTNLIFGTTLFFVPFYLTYKFRKEDLFEKMNFFISMVLTFLMAYLSYKGLEKITLFFQWSTLLHLWAIFIFAIHLIIMSLSGDKRRLEWDPKNGDSWPN